jgi:putative membrane protein
LFGLAVIAACDARRVDPTLAPVKSSPQATAHIVPAARGASLQPRIHLVQAGAVSAADVEFVSSAASASALEVEASRVALEKSKTPAVRNFAQKMIDEHSKAGAELRALKLASSVGNVAAMSPKEGAQVRKLKELNGREFDREYVAQIGVAAHQQAVNAFQKAATSAADTQLKSFAQAKLPGLREHLQMAQALAKNVGASAPNAKEDPLAQQTK